LLHQSGDRSPVSGGADSAGLTWPLPEDHDDRRLNELLFPARPDYPPSVPRPGLDFTEVHRQMQANRFVTLQLLWEEYREKQSGGYGYSRYVAAVFMLRSRLKTMTDTCAGDVHAT